MPIQPLEDRVIVRPDAVETVTASGLHLVPKDKDKTTFGVVIAVGPGKTLKDGNRRPVDVKVGQKVVFPLYMGTEIDIEGTMHRVIREDDLLAVFES